MAYQLRQWYDEYLSLSLGVCMFAGCHDTECEYRGMLSLSLSRVFMFAVCHAT